MTVAIHQRADTSRAPLLIVGASARAAAFSARRAGLTPWTADLFADRDLAHACDDCRQVADYPRGFLTVSRDGPPGPWIYTGALENAPALVRELALRRVLWGNPAPILRRVRSPFTIVGVLGAHGVTCPEVVESLDATQTKRWLRKPRASASGRGVAFAETRTGASAGHYLQEYIEGEPSSAVYVAAGGRARLLGMTRQLVGEAWLHSGLFRYCGNIGPLPMSAKLNGALAQLGQVLTTAFALRGLFGVDFILRDDTPWPVEINPRYTASVEVLELATGQAFLALHAQAFGEQVTVADRPPITGMLAKAIYFAADSLCFP